MQEKQTASAPDWTKGTKKAPSEALRCGIPVPPPAQSAGAVGDSGPQYPGGLKGPLRQLQEFSGPLHLLPAELFRPQSFQFLLFFFVHNYSSVSMVSSALRRSSSSASFTHGSCSRMVRLDSRGERDSSVLASAV